MMQNKEITDERVIAQKRKIQSNAFSILVGLLLVSILFQQYILKAPVTQFAGELLSLIAVAIYIPIKNIKLGLEVANPNASNPKKLFVNSVVLSATSTVIFRFVSGEKSILSNILFFLSSTFAYFLVNLALDHFVKKRQKEIDQELNQEE